MKVLHTMLWILVSLGHGRLTYAQEFLPTPNSYRFIDYKANTFSYPGDSLDFLTFLKKFDHLIGTGKGRINIVHFGGSHVQADMWTGRIRQHFNQFTGQKYSDRGMIFPYASVKTNGSSQYSVQFNKPWSGLRNVKLHGPEMMGLMGWKATAHDSGQYLRFVLNGDAKTTFVFDHLRVFHDTGVQMIPFTIQVDSLQLQSDYNPQCGCTEFAFSSFHHSFELMLHKTESHQTEFVLHGIQTQLQAPGITYHSVGVNGASVPSFLHCQLLPQQLRVIKPDLLVFSIGINDAFSPDFTAEKWIRNYSELIRKLHEQHIYPAIVFMSNTDSYKTERRRQYKNLTGNDVQSAVYQLAKKHNAVVWDLYQVMGGLGSISEWKSNGLAQRDLVHLTRQGYELAGDLFFTAFLEAYTRFTFQRISQLRYE
jgi:lysophospholipase L1-like esterase